jgi:hypothetical protein
MLSQPPGVKERRRPSREMLQKVSKLSLELRIAARSLIRLFELLYGVHERFRHIAPAEFPEAPARIRP